MKENVDSKGKSHEHTAKCHRQDKLSLVILQGHGSGHGPGKSLGISPQHHGDTHFGNHPTKGGNPTWRAPNPRRKAIVIQIGSIESLFYYCCFLNSYTIYRTEQSIP